MVYFANVSCINVTAESNNFEMYFMIKLQYNWKNLQSKNKNIYKEFFCKYWWPVDYVDNISLCISNKVHEESSLNTEKEEKKPVCLDFILHPGCPVAQRHRVLYVSVHHPLRLNLHVQTVSRGGSFSQ